jgi:uncharacterized membrane protein
MSVKDVALCSILAAVYAVVNLLPGFPVIGVSGSEIELSRSLEMVYGFLLGPWFGSLTAFLGCLLGCVFTGAGLFGFLRAPCALISAFIAGAITQKDLLKRKGWMISAVLLGLLILAWYCTWAGFIIPFYPILHYAALFILLIFRGKLADFFHSQERSRLLISMASSSYVSTMAGHMFGTLIFISCIGWIFPVNPALPRILVSLVPITASERITLTVISTIIGVPLILTTRKQLHLNTSSKF